MVRTFRVESAANVRGKANFKAQEVGGATKVSGIFDGNLGRGDLLTGKPENGVLKSARKAKA